MNPNTAARESVQRIQDRWDREKKISTKDVETLLDLAGIAANPVLQSYLRRFDGQFGGPP